MPSVANVNGTDLSKYKIVSQYQFAYNPMHVGRDEVLPISMLENPEPVIVSPAYLVFEIEKPEELLPEYLMMWCRRPEFDRNAWFTTDSSVRGGFSWNDFCEMELPVPHPDKQREIVREYNTIVNRIKLNEQVNQKLEETAQALYKHWFVDFEFPISAEYAAKVGKPELEGKPYKSSGGEMKFCEELEQEIPSGWGSEKYTSIIDLKGGGTPKTEVTAYWNGDIPFFTPGDVMNSIFCTSTEKSITEIGLKNSSTKVYPKNTVFITARGTVGALSVAAKDMAMNQSCYAAIGKSKISQYFVHQHTKHTLDKLKNEANGGVFGSLVTKDFDYSKVINPKRELIEEFHLHIKKIYKKCLINQLKNESLNSFKALVLSGIVQQNKETA